MSRFILASNSPRRKDLLSAAGYKFEILPSDVDETLPDGISPKNAVELLATRKCKDIVDSVNDSVVLGCDTVVAINGKILGKPADEKEAFQMLKMLSGNTHSVFTGVCISNDSKETVFSVETRVKFYQLSDETILSYISTGEPMDKAGSYGIQGLGVALVKKIEGDYSTVVGLPLAQTQRVLAEYSIYGTIKL